MHLKSDSITPYTHIHPRLAFCAADPSSHATFSGNRNPHLSWSGVPEGTKSFALICVDHDVPSEGDAVNQEGKTVPLDLPRADFYHWVIADLPSSLSEIPEGRHADGVTPRGKAPGPTPDGGVQGLNDYTGWFEGDADMGGQYAGYDGPCPPWNDARMHAYRFTVYALDVETLGLSLGFTGAQLKEAMAGHILDSAELIGLYTLNPDTAAAAESAHGAAWS